MPTRTKARYFNSFATIAPEVWEQNKEARRQAYEREQTEIKNRKVERLTLAEYVKQIKSKIITETPGCKDFKPSQVKIEWVKKPTMIQYPTGLHGLIGKLSITAPGMVNAAFTFDHAAGYSWSIRKD